MNLSERYSRQIMLEPIGEAGQKKLSQASVLLVGVGGLGSPIALYLTGAGVGRLGLIDGDVVSESNLQRQVLYTEEEIGRPKAECARRRLQALSSTIEIDVYPYFLTRDNALSIIQNYDIVVDGCDNFASVILLTIVAVRPESLMCMVLSGNFGGKPLCSTTGEVSAIETFILMRWSLLPVLLSLEVCWG